MNCHTARSLIDRGIEPGSANALRAALGFHIAQCAECRAYHRAARSDFLAGLLDTPAKRPAPVPQRAEPAPLLSARPPRWNPTRLVFAAVGALVVLLVLFVGIPAASALVRIRQNVQAMIIPTEAATSVPTATPGQELAPVAAVLPTAEAVLPSPTIPALTPEQAAVVLPDLTPSPTTPRVLPTATITPVPLDAILSVGRPMLPQPTLSAANLSSGTTSSGDRAITVLVMGVDRRPGEGTGTRSDTIIVARLDPVRQRIAMLSLPRDLIVQIPGFGYARINAANAYGELNDGPGGGLALTRRTVSNLLGVPIDYVVQVDFQGFIGAIDALGGLDIDVPTEIYDPEYPTMDYGYTVAHFLPGLQHMDGERALMYARTRHADSDFQRMRRQQSVLVGVLERVRAQNMLDQLRSVADVTAALRGYIQTDMPEDQMVRLAWNFRTTSPESVERYTLDENAVQVGVIPDDYYAMVANPGAIEALAYDLIVGTK